LLNWRARNKNHSDTKSTSGEMIKNWSSQGRSLLFFFHRLFCYRTLDALFELAPLDRMVLPGPFILRSSSLANVNMCLLIVSKKNCWFYYKTFIVDRYSQLRQIKRLAQFVSLHIAHSLLLSFWWQ
jgi:hypothetical protein